MSVGPPLPRPRKQAAPSPRPAKERPLVRRPRRAGRPGPQPNTAALSHLAAPGRGSEAHSARRLRRGALCQHPRLQRRTQAKAVPQAVRTPVFPALPRAAPVFLDVRSLPGFCVRRPAPRRPLLRNSASPRLAVPPASALGPSPYPLAAVPSALPRPRTSVPPSPPALHPAGAPSCSPIAPSCPPRRPLPGSGFPHPSDSSGSPRTPAPPFPSPVHPQTPQTPSFLILKFCPPRAFPHPLAGPRPAPATRRAASGLSFLPFPSRLFPLPGALPRGRMCAGRAEAAAPEDPGSPRRPPAAAMRRPRRGPGWAPGAQVRPRAAPGGSPRAGARRAAGPGPSVWGAVWNLDQPQGRVVADLSGPSPGLRPPPFGCRAQRHPLRGEGRSSRVARVPTLSRRARRPQPRCARCPPWSAPPPAPGPLPPHARGREGRRSPS